MHQAPGPKDDFAEWEFDLVRREARAFATDHQLRWSDVADLEQVGSEALLRQRQRYDPTRGATRRTYLKRVVRNAFKDVQKAERTESRQGEREAISLDAKLDGGQTLGDLLAGDLTAIDTYPTRAAIERALVRLTLRQREQVRLRILGYRPKEIAAELTVHRDTVHADMRRIRTIFREEVRG